MPDIVSPFKPGQLWSTSTGRAVEIVAADHLEAEVAGELHELRVVAFRFVGGSMVHLRPAYGLDQSWIKINAG